VANSGHDQILCPKVSEKTLCLGSTLGVQTVVTQCQAQ